MEQKKVILDFTSANYADAEACDEKNLIHRSKLEEFLKIFREQFLLAKSEKEKWEGRECEVRNFHNAISIYASRGAGKTTFLLSAIRRIHDEYGDSVVCLDTIDPSLIDTKQRPIVNIIAAIHEKVRDYLCKKDIFNKKEDAITREVLENHYKTVLKALPFIEGIGKETIYYDWDDEEYVASQGIEKAIACNNLEGSFQQYLYYALKLMKKTCFVIPFDDIDTDFTKGYEILEIIRKYLTTPFVITVMTGDLELYGKLVRKESWNFFDEGLINKEYEYAQKPKKEFATLINQLENQYLVKILKPEYRISINTMKEYIDDTTYRLGVFVKFIDDMEPITLQECYRTFLKEMGFSEKNEKQMREMTSFLMSLSMRFQMRLLCQIKTIYEISNISNRSLADGVLNVFWNDLNQMTLNAKALLKSSDNYTVEMFKFLMNTRSLAYGGSFLPETNNEVLNRALFAVGAKFNELDQKYPHFIFDFWARISYVSVLQSKIESENSLYMDVDMLEYSGFDTDSGLMKSICKAHACSTFLERPPYEINNLTGITKIKSDKLFLLLDANNQIALLPLLGIIDSNNVDRAYISIYKYIALISELVQQMTQINVIEEDDIVELLINKLGQYRSYMEPGQSRKSEEDLERKSSAPHFYYDAEGNESLASFIHEIIDWYNTTSRRNLHISCQLLQKIFIRFYYTILHIDLRDETMGSGDLFSKYLCALLNASLVEESIDKRIGGVNLNNVGDIDDIYVGNLTYISKHQKRQKRAMYSLHSWLSECPLIKCFLSPVIKYILDGGSSEYYKAWRQYKTLETTNARMKIELSDTIDKTKKLKSDLKEINSLLDLIHQRYVLSLYEKGLSLSSPKDENFEANKKFVEDMRQIVNHLSEQYRRPVIIPSLKIDIRLQSSEEEIINAKNLVLTEIGKMESMQEKTNDIISGNTKKLDELKGFAIDDYKKIIGEKTPFAVLNNNFSIIMS